MVPGGAGPEMRKALENMIGILEASGSSVDKVVKTMIFVSDLNDFGIINDEYKKGMHNRFLVYNLCTLRCLISLSSSSLNP